LKSSSKEIKWRKLEVDVTPLTKMTAILKFEMGKILKSGHPQWASKMRYFGCSPKFSNTNPYRVAPHFNDFLKRKYMVQTGGQYHIPNQNGGHFKIQDGLIFIH
jgi:hypothetical protein